MAHFTFFSDTAGRPRLRYYSSVLFSWRIYIFSGDHSKLGQVPPQKSVQRGTFGDCQCEICVTAGTQPTLSKHWRTRL